MIIYYVDWALMEERKAHAFLVCRQEGSISRQLVAEFEDEADAHEYCAMKNGK